MTYQFGVKYRGIVRSYPNLTPDQLDEMLLILGGYDEPVAVWIRTEPENLIHIRVRR
jgi:hypothetical protein